MNLSQQLAAKAAALKNSQEQEDIFRVVRTDGDAPHDAGVAAPPMETVVLGTRPKKSINTQTRSAYLPDIHRSLPQSLDAEKGVLCSCLLSPGILKSGEVNLTTEHFYHPPHQIIYGEMLDIVEHTDKLLDFISLTQVLRDKGDLDKAGGAAAISELFTFVPTATNADYYTEIVHEKYILRQLIQACTEMSSRAYDEQGDVKCLLEGAEAKYNTVEELSHT